MHPLEALPRVECAQELLRHCAPGSGMIVRSFFLTWVSLILPVLAPAWDAFCRSESKLSPSNQDEDADQRGQGWLDASKRPRVAFFCCPLTPVCREGSTELAIKKELPL